MRRRFPILARLARRLAREDGLALVVALGMTSVLGITGATAMAYATTNSGASSRSKAEHAASMLAEAGLNYAYSTLYAASNPSMESALPPEASPASKQLEPGTAEWYGKLEGGVWTLTGVGRVRNPTAPGSPIVRRVRGRVRLGSSTRGSSNNAIWNYVYADDLTSCTTIRNSSEVNVPFYVRGNLCIENQAKVTGYALQVGGTVTITNTQGSVGSAAAPITEAHIAGGCKLANGPLHNPCGPADNVYATKMTSAPTALTKPPVELERWYRDSMPGPMHPCTVGSLPGGFDTDQTMNRSRPAFNLTPSTGYDCRVYDAAGSLLGQITWTPGDPGSLVIKGTIFFDGDIWMGQYSNAVYQGGATIYASGRITIGQQSTLCGIAGCTANWKATENLLAFVAGSSTDATSFEISNYSTFQGAVYSVNDYREGNNSTVWGPIIAKQIYLQNSTLNHYVPIGTLLPGMPATYEESVTLSNESGSWG